MVGTLGEASLSKTLLSTPPPHPPLIPDCPGLITYILFRLRHDLRNYGPGENLQYTCGLNSKNVDSWALRYLPPLLE